MASFQEQLLVMFLQFALLFISLSCGQSYTPNIIIITADDIGSADVGWSNAENAEVTPFLNQYERHDDTTVLNNYYVMPNGHATRTALLTAKHPAVLGTQFEETDGTKPYGLDPSYTLLSEYLKDLGYSCHAVGQWDLGFYSKDMLPTERGYDTFYGSYLSYGDYTKHTAEDKVGDVGLDLHDNSELDTSPDFSFKTELYSKRAEAIIDAHDSTKPLHLYLALQSAQIKDMDTLCKTKENDKSKIPNSYYRQVPDSETDETRRCYLALLAAVDQAYGRIMSALRGSLLLSDSIVIFTSTSGGPSAGGHRFNAASNMPYRGAKLTGWEGGVKGVALVYSEKFEVARSNCLFHVTDWIPTILTLYKNARGDEEALSTAKFKPMYGVDQYNCLTTGQLSTSQRHSIIHFLYGKTFSIQTMQHKYVVNTDRKLAEMNEWYSGRSAICGESNEQACDPVQRACLFNIQEDVCEMRNIIDYPNTEPYVDEIKVIIADFNKTVKYSAAAESDTRGYLANNGGSWQPWVESVNTSTAIKPSYLLYLIACALLTAYCS